VNRIDDAPKADFGKPERPPLSEVQNEAHGDSECRVTNGVTKTQRKAPAGVSSDKPFVTIVMPALNEESYIAAAIQSLLPDPGVIDYELLVLDGGSTDDTEAIVRRLSSLNSRIRLVANERKIQSAAVNIAARIADPRSNYLVRADCHSIYPKRFVEICVQALREKNAASVVVSMHTVGRTPLQRAIAAAQNSRLGNGASKHRLTGWSGYVDHGHHAAFDRHTFLELDGYDENFICNEDAELDTRILKSNRNIYLSGDATITYFPRRDFRGLARQYFNFGAGRAKTVLKHRVFPKLRQLAPLGAFLACAASLVLSPIEPRLLIIPTAYLAICFGLGLGLAIKERDWHFALSGVAAVVMHMSWAVGFLYELARFK
jgi:succinoglycan biosynthesis protein ExoA